MTVYIPIRRFIEKPPEPYLRWCGKAVQAELERLGFDRSIAHTHTYDPVKCRYVYSHIGDE